MTMRCLGYHAVLVVLLLACRDRAERSSADAGTSADARAEREPGEAGADAPNSQQRLPEAGSAAQGTNIDASAGDAGRGSDASQDGAAAGSETTQSGQRDGGMRAAICGDATTWPRPFTGTNVAAQSVGGDFGFLEGPAWNAAQGVLLFSDMDMSQVGPLGPPARIRRLRPPAAFDVFVEESNSNGLALWGSEAIIAATHDTQALSLFDLDSGARTKLAVLTENKHFNSPNDLTVRSDGTIYFTDPDWQKTDSRVSETMTTGVYRLPPPLSTDGVNDAILIEGGLNEPNGVALSPDERTLYLGSNESEIWRYDVASDGSLSGRTKFAETGSSDGMAVDCAGNLYVASGTIEVFAPDGTKLGEITLADTPSNAAFGGADRKTLYITAGAHLYSIALNVPGFPY